MVRSNIISLSSYKKYCSLLRRILRNAEKDYNKNKLKYLGNDMRKNWKMLNKLMGKRKQSLSKNFEINDEIVSDRNFIANAFNNHFVNNPVHIQNSIKM